MSCTNVDLFMSKGQLIADVLLIKAANRIQKKNDLHLYKISISTGIWLVGD